MSGVLSSPSSSHRLQGASPSCTSGNTSIRGVRRQLLPAGTVPAIAEADPTGTVVEAAAAETAEAAKLPGSSARSQQPAAPKTAASPASSGNVFLRGNNAAALQIRGKMVCSIPSAFVKEHKLEPGWIKMGVKVNGVQLAEYPCWEANLKGHKNRSYLEVRPGHEMCTALLAAGNWHQGWWMREDGTLFLLMGSDTKRVSVSGGKKKLAGNPRSQSSSEPQPGYTAAAADSPPPSPNRLRAAASGHTPLSGSKRPSTPTHPNGPTGRGPDSESGHSVSEDESLAAHPTDSSGAMEGVPSFTSPSSSAASLKKTSAPRGPTSPAVSAHQRITRTKVVESGSAGFANVQANSSGVRSHLVEAPAASGGTQGALSTGALSSPFLCRLDGSNRQQAGAYTAQGGHTVSLTTSSGAGAAKPRLPRLHVLHQVSSPSHPYHSGPAPTLLLQPSAQRASTEVSAETTGITTSAARVAAPANAQGPSRGKACVSEAHTDEVSKGMSEMSVASKRDGDRDPLEPCGVKAKRWIKREVLSIGFTRMIFLLEPDEELGLAAADKWPLLSNLQVDRFFESTYSLMCESYLHNKRAFMSKILQQLLDTDTTKPEASITPGQS